MKIFCEKCESVMTPTGWEAATISVTRRIEEELENMKVVTEKTGQVYWCTLCKKSHTVLLPR